MILMRAVTACQKMEGEGEERDRTTRFIWTVDGESEPKPSEAGEGSRGGFLCALFGAEVMTERP